MWLMHVETRRLEEFFNDEVPPYAILSHTWGREEVTFQDLGKVDHRKQLGYAKIEGCCQQALKDNLSYVWVDTCCIDKTSSVELSEAINSMFRWYADAKVCYAYLEDVQPSENAFDDGSLFRQSRWFGRGWTLQELIAPACIVFFDSAWKSIFQGIGPIARNRKKAQDDRQFDLLSTLTGIPWRVLTKKVALTSVSTACKLSWAARRKTTRVEDMAYCLLGILHVNMPLLYGEGEKAFVRLQEAALSTSDDISPLLWGYGLPLNTDTQSRNPEKAGTVLADTPAAFLCYPEGNRRNIRHAPRVHTTPTGHGLQVDLPMLCIDRPRAIWLGIVTEDLAQEYWWDDKTMHGMAIVLEEQSNRFQRAIGCPPVRIRHFDLKRLWYQRGTLALRTIYLQDNVPRNTYFTMQYVARHSLWPKLRQFVTRVFTRRKMRVPIELREKRHYPWIPGEELRNAAIERTSLSYETALQQAMGMGVRESLPASRTPSPASFTVVTPPPSPEFVFSTYALREKGFTLHSVYPPLRRGHYYKEKDSMLLTANSSEIATIPVLLCQKQAGSTYVYIFSNGQGTQFAVKLTLSWQTAGINSCKFLFAVCGENDTALQHHPNLASNPVLYRHHGDLRWATEIKLTDVPPRPLRIHASPASQEAELSGSGFTADCKWLLACSERIG